MRFAKEGNRDQHDGEDYSEENKSRHKEDQSGLGVDGESHEDGSKDDEGTSQQEAKGHIDTGLDLVGVRGHPCDEGIRAQGIQFCVGEGLDVIEELLAHLCGKAHTGLGGEPLGHEGEEHAGHS